MLRRTTPFLVPTPAALACAFCAFCTFLACWGAGCDRDEPPDLSVPLPSFELVDQHGQPFQREDMRGQVWIADFVFTKCPTICPTLSARMKGLTERFEGENDLRFVSFSVDPEHDTPEVLREHASRYGVDFERWTWVTGSTGEVSDVVVGGFKLALGEPVATGREDGQYDIMHSAHLVLVDREANVRGYYPANDPEAMDDLVRDAGALLEDR